jgi:hypothetical protein
MQGGVPYPAVRDALPTPPWLNSFHRCCGHSSRWTENSSGLTPVGSCPQVVRNHLSSLTLTRIEFVLTDHSTVVRSGVP